jgi:lysophospholipase L1-like esterase
MMAVDPHARRATHHVLFRVVAFGLGLAVSLVVVEALMRLLPLRPRTVAAPPPPAGPEVGRTPAIGWGGEPTPWFWRYDGRAISQRAQLVPFGVFTCDSAVAPGAQPVCRTGRQNSSGFRMPEFTIAHPPDTFRIVIIGDSYTWGDGTELEQTYHRMLQGLYDRAHGGAAPKVEIIALAMNGNSFLDNVTRLLTYGERLHPDLVLVQYCDNDLQYRAMLDLFRAQEDAGYADFLLTTTDAGRLLRDRIQVRRQSALFQAETERIYDPESQEWQLFRSALGILDRWRSASGVPVALLSLPDVDRTGRTRNFDGYRNVSWIVKLEERVEREVERHGIPVLRVIEAFRARAGDRFLAVSETNAHYGPYANQLVADATFEFLRNADWVDIATPRSRAGDAGWALERRLRDQAAARWGDYYESGALQVDLFSQLLEIHPDDPWLIQDLARVHHAEGRFAECRASYLRLAAVAPRFAAPWFHASLCTDDVAEQEGLLTRMLESVPDHAGAAQRLAGVDEAAGRIPRACGCYQRLTEIGSFALQTRAAIDGVRRLDCQRIAVQPCPGPEPLGRPAR